MFKHCQHIAQSLLCAALLVLAGTACSTEEVDPTNGGNDSRADGKVAVTMHLGVQEAGSATRAKQLSRADFGDANAEEGEMMKRWFVVVADASGKIVKIAESGTLTEEKEDDEFLLVAEAGTYTFYSFANLSLADVGLTAASTTLPAGFEARTLSVNGNQASIDAFADGIPMSNKETKVITKETKEVNLEVVRMVAKARLSLTNSTGSALNVKKVTLSDITQNGVADNLMLLPAETGGTLVPHLNTAAVNARTGRDLYSVSVGKTIAVGATEDVSFYLNESEAYSPHHFLISVETDGGTVRYAMLDWDQIARNDLRVVPITLTDYKMDFDIEAFTPIGVLPVVDVSDGALSVEFRTYGEFHIIPKVTKLSDGSTVSNWTFTSWTLTDGAASIFDTTPAWTAATRRIEGEMGIDEGYALYELTYQIPGESLVRSTRIELRMSPDLYASAARSGLAAPAGAATSAAATDAPRAWQRVSTK